MSSKKQHEHVILPFHNQQSWETIETHLKNTISSPEQLEEVVYAISGTKTSFYVRYFSGKDNKFPHFFVSVLPFIQQVALELPHICSDPIPLLYSQKDMKVSFGQKQIVSILSHAFLCTLPEPVEYGFDTQAVNFGDLFRSALSFSKVRAKLECIFHYFDRMSQKRDFGVVSIHRQVLTSPPDWQSSYETLAPLKISTEGSIENSFAVRHADFANMYIGGGVMGSAVAQEEILFCIKPECLISLLICEKMAPKETIILIGAERFVCHSGFGNGFHFDGDYVDETPQDKEGHRESSIVAMDAVVNSYPLVQFTRASIRRDLDKAFCGFSGRDKGDKGESGDRFDIATGHWGCGAFGGNKHLKFVQQLMAAAKVGARVEYYTFGDENFTQAAREVYDLLVQKNVTVGKLWDSLMEYRNKQDKANDNGEALTVFQHLRLEFSDS